MNTQTPYQAAISALETLKELLTPTVADTATHADIAAAALPGGPAAPAPIPAAPSAGLFTTTLPKLSQKMEYTITTIANAIRNSGQIILRTDCGSYYTIIPREGLQRLSPERFPTWLAQNTGLNTAGMSRAKAQRIMASPEFTAETTHLPAAFILYGDTLDSVASIIADKVYKYTTATPNH